jgi:hypothetical protein
MRVTNQRVGRRHEELVHRGEQVVTPRELLERERVSKGTEEGSQRSTAGEETRYVECGLQAVAVAATGGRHAVPVLALLDQQTSTLAHAAEVAVEKLRKGATPNREQQQSHAVSSSHAHARRERERADQLKAMRRLAKRPL